MTPRPNGARGYNAMARACRRLARWGPWVHVVIALLIIGVSVVSLDEGEPFRWTATTFVWPTVGNLLAGGVLWYLRPLFQVTAHMWDAMGREEAYGVHEPAHVDRQAEGDRQRRKEDDDGERAV